MHLYRYLWLSRERAGPGAHLRLAVRSSLTPVLLYLSQTPFYYITSYTKDEIPELATSTTLKVTIPLLVMNLSGAVGRVNFRFFSTRIFFACLLT